MGLAERADVIVDFRGLANGTTVRLINTAPDAPFGGFPDIPADPGTTGQVMQFVVNTVLNGTSPTDPGGATPATAPQNLKFKLADPSDKAAGGIQKTVRNLALLEEESALVCATVSVSGTVSYDSNATPDPLNPGTCVTKQGKLAKSVPFAPKAAVLGVNGSGGGSVTLWSDPIQTNPVLNATETWELWNWTVDGHPIHLHLVKFKVVNREAFDPQTGALSGTVNPPVTTEAGWKDTVIAYPGEVTRVNATFDIEGLYVWHCHIVEHEDNEMMVPYCVGDKTTAPGCNVVP
jgi:FtsP/CotA-like multicopper oxidase with cupredoxin domain